MTRRRWAHLLLGLAGLAAIAWAVVWGASPQITCGEVVMGPGDSCTQQSRDGSVSTKVQTYEERFEASQAARPVVGTVGLLVVGFAAHLWVSDSTREESHVP